MIERKFDLSDFAQNNIIKIRGKEYIDVCYTANNELRKIVARRSITYGIT